VPVLAVLAAVLAVVVAVERPRLVLPDRIRLPAVPVRAPLARLATAAARDVGRPAVLRGAALLRAHGTDLTTLSGGSGPRIRPYPGLEMLAA